MIVKAIVEPIEFIPSSGAFESYRFEYKRTPAIAEARQAMADVYRSMRRDNTRFARMYRNAVKASTEVMVQSVFSQRFP